MGKMSLTSCRALSTPGKFSNVDRYGDDHVEYIIHSDPCICPYICGLCRVHLYFSLSDCLLFFLYLHVHIHLRTSCFAPNGFTELAICHLLRGHMKGSMMVPAHHLFAVCAGRASGRDVDQWLCFFSSLINEYESQWVTAITNWLLSFKNSH